MKKLFTSLSNKIRLFRLKRQLKGMRIVIKPFPKGAFYGIEPGNLEFKHEVVYDDVDGIEYNVNYICSCESNVFVLGAGFGCVHCDSICNQSNCEICKSLYAKDLWGRDANL